MFASAAFASETLPIKVSLYINKCIINRIVSIEIIRELIEELH
ncbi:hypothetical protein ABIA69_002781 [Lysinibacillus parviboronicapiens]|uniref:Uncharacterized protein n=1 Tax=Lysinibacillus parviboronicapiens TaxID=436516 RepID=A0ABV2PKZ0_9BACI